MVLLTAGGATCSLVGTSGNYIYWVVFFFLEPELAQVLLSNVQLHRRNG